MPSYRWKDILWTLQPPDPDVLGWLDLPSGVLFLNEEMDDLHRWRELPRSDDPRGQALAQTVSHETLHFLQVVTTGYMLRWACEHYRCITQALKPFKDLAAAYLDEPDPKTLLALTHRVDPAHRDALQQHLQRLDRPGPNGISVRHLLEAQAFIAEQKLHWQGLDAGGLHRLLAEQSPGLPYRLAYDVVRLRLGDPLAFNHYLLISNLALCCDDPPEALDRLLDELARRPRPAAPGHTDIDWVRDALQAAHCGVIGSAGQVLDADRTLHHPVYVPAVHALGEAFDHGWDLMAFFANPAQGLGKIASQVTRPTVFRANARDQFLVIVPPPLEESHVTTLLLFATLASRIVADAPLAEAAETAAEDDRWAWLPEVRSELVQLSMRRVQVERVDLGTLAALDPAQAGLDDRRLLCRLWGRCALTLDIDDPAPLWTRPDVRRFIHALAEAQPAFPVYFAPNAAFGMFTFWFGTLADPAAWQGTRLAIQHPSVSQWVMSTVVAIDRLAKSQGLSARPALQGLLTPYDRDQVQALLALLG